ncbi:hypothetical protein MN608_10001 [Microdochium nivale]|nr:hypothetical protein MN608_10001 [Microdochium nivale]
MRFPFATRKQRAAQPCKLIDHHRRPAGRIKRFLLGHFGCFFPEGASDVGDAPRPALPPFTAGEQAIITRINEMSDAEFSAAFDSLVQARLAAFRHTHGH